MPCFRFARIAVILLLAGLLGGCAQTVLKLSYPAPEGTVAPRAGAPSICVVLLEDTRGKSEIGEYSNGTKIYPQTAVNDWISRGLADELAAEGFVVSYAQTMNQAMASKPGYILSGVVDDVWLQEKSITSYSCTMRATVSLLRGDGSHMLKNNFTSTITRGTIPLVGSGQSALTDAVVELVRPVAKKVGQTLLQ